MTSTDSKIPPKASNQPPIRGWWAWAATLFSGFLVSLCLPPVGAGPLILVAFVPWLLALRGFRTAFGAGLASLLAGVLAHLIPFAFLNDMVGYAGTESAMAGLWLASVMICATTYFFVGIAARWLMLRTDRRWWALVIPLIWMGAEELRYHFPVPSPLLLPGYALFQIDALIQIAELGSVHLVSGFVLFVAATITIALDAKLCHDTKGKLFAPVALTTGFVIVLAFGMQRMSHYADEIQLAGGPRVAVIQPDIPQEIKNQNNQEARWKLNHAMSVEAAAKDPDLIIWSESAFPYLIYPSGFLLEHRSGPAMEPSRTAQELDTPLLIGTISKPSAEDLARPEYDFYSADEKQRATYNSVFFYDQNGVLQGRHDKAHLVAGGEEIPYQHSFVGEIVQTYASGLLEGFQTSLIPGYRREVMHLHDRRGNDWRFSTKVCYEFAFPQLAAKIHNNPDLPEDQRNVHFVATLSNEGWYQGGAELDQALIYSRFRAIESRTTVVRATNDGISAVIGPLGIERQRLRDAEGRDRQTKGILEADLPYLVKPELTLYLRIGNAPYVFLRWCLLIFLALMPIDILRRRVTRRQQKRSGVDDSSRPPATLAAAPESEAEVSGADAKAD